MNFDIERCDSTPNGSSKCTEDQFCFIPHKEANGYCRGNWNK